MPLKDANESTSSDDNETEILDVEAPETPVKDASDASSSDANGEVEGSDILNVVRDVVDERKEKPETAASPAEGSETGEGAGEQPPAKEVDNVGYTDVPFHKHPRFQTLLKERNENVTDAGRYRNVQRFLDDSGMSADEAANGLTIMAQAKVDPVGAWNAIKPWVQKLLVAAGEVIPDDLQARVASGELTRDAALEIGRHRATAESVKSSQSFKEAQAEQRGKRELADKLVSTATGWETERKARDPNFAAKIVPLQKEIAYLHQQEGKPNTPEGVLDQLTRAYKAVNESFRPAAPAVKRPAIRPITGGQVAQNIRSDPKSTLDIVRANRRTG